MNPETKHLVATYGSLKRGYWNHHLLEGRSTFIGEAVTKPDFTLINCRPEGGYPILIDGGHTPVKCEVFEVDDNVLKNLDRLEGHPEWYKRTPIEVAMKDGGVSTVEIYLQRPDQVHYEPCQLIPSGEWLGGD